MVKAMIARPPSFQPVKKPGSEAKGAPLLDPNGPEVVIGWQDNSPAIPNSPDKAVLFSYARAVPMRRWLILGGRYWPSPNFGLEQPTDTG